MEREFPCMRRDYLRFRPRSGSGKASGTIAVGAGPNNFQMESELVGFPAAVLIPGE